MAVSAYAPGILLFSCLEQIDIVYNPLVHSGSHANRVFGRSEGERLELQQEFEAYFEKNKAAFGGEAPLLTFKNIEGI